MARTAAQGQRHAAHKDEYLRSWPPPGELSVPAIVINRGGRHRRADVVLKGVPRAIPPHPPLVSGGWYRSLVRREVLGPGRYPVEAPPADKSVGAAVVLAAVGGPLGICYCSVTAGVIATGIAAMALVGFGFGALVVIWPLAIVAAAISAGSRHMRFARQ